MKMTVDKKLCARQAGRDIIFAPQVLGSAGKHRFAMSSVTAQFVGEAQDAIQIGARAIFLALAFHATKGFPGQVLNQNHVLFMRFVAWCGQLKIKTDGTGFFILKFSQFTDLFAGNTHG